jgi:hypothetical protein
VAPAGPAAAARDRLEIQVKWPRLAA